MEKIIVVSFFFVGYTLHRLSRCWGGENIVVVFVLVGCV